MNLIMVTYRSMTLDCLIKDTLKWINKKREEHALPPLNNICMGYKYVAEACPVANSLRYGSSLLSGVGVDKYYFASVDEVKPLPECARVFISRFDKGEYKEYENTY